MAFNIVTVSGPYAVAVSIGGAGQSVFCVTTMAINAVTVSGLHAVAMSIGGVGAQRLLSGHYGNY